ncbi:CPBP family intramembrane glutamic endopeptidase [Salinibaculum rarum]|uniref:CPBP family intramembrane glutamic endopeptidase n=1 Tax=Salinibaculum rarum TaxID=3058903 RepID=UPI00265E70DD|nr:CPBP family intramembrane glutamic endopeptidase [Salinibaculum sp. KK48]
MPGWVPFTGLTAVVVLLLLGLARLSQRAVDDQPALPDARESTATPDTPGDGDGERAGVAVGDESTPTETTSSSVTVESDQVDAGPTTKSDRGDGELESSRSADDTPGAGPEFSTGALLANVALTQGLFGVALAVGAWYYEIPLSALGLTETAVGTGALAIGVGIVFGVVLWVANETSASVADAVGATYDESLRGMLAPETIPGWVLLLGIILPTIALVEELLFRAALIGVPAAGFGISPLALAIFSSALFALGHGAQGKVGIAVTGGLGLVLAGGYILSGSLLVVVVAHYLVNALEFLVHEGLGADRF